MRIEGLNPSVWFRTIQLHTYPHKPICNLPGSLPPQSDIINSCLHHNSFTSPPAPTSSCCGTAISSSQGHRWLLLHLHSSSSSLCTTSQIHTALLPKVLPKSPPVYKTLKQTTFTAKYMLRLPKAWFIYNCPTLGGNSSIYIYICSPRDMGGRRISWISRVQDQPWYKTKTLPQNK